MFQTCHQSALPIIQKSSNIFHECFVDSLSQQCVDEEKISFFQEQGHGYLMVYLRIKNWLVEN